MLIINIGLEFLQAMKSNLEGSVMNKEGGQAQTWDLDSKGQTEMWRLF